ncbi:MAG: TonB-dependent receptor [Thermoanaerobaculia bacterium]
MRYTVCGLVRSLVGFLVMLGSLPLAAQTTGDLEANIVDAAGAPLPGASVEIRSTTLQGARTAVTDARGGARFALLPPGTYSVRALLAGFGPGQTEEVRVGLGETTAVRLAVALATSAGVEVSAEFPLVDTTHTLVGTSIPSTTLARLPLGRNFSSAILTTPGAGTDVAGNTVYGATGLENSYVVDGLNTTGVFSANQGKQLNLEFVQEVEVRVGGYEAEYGSAMGASVNVVTKSGGNELRGDVFGYYDSDSLTASDEHLAERTSLNLALPEPATRYDLGADLGGFVLRDRLWFFGAFDRVATAEDYQRAESLTYTPTAVVPNYVGGRDDTRSNLFSAKLTLRLGDSNSFVVSAFGDPTTFDGRAYKAQRGPDSAVLVRKESGGTDVVARWEGVLGPRFLGQAQYGFHEEADVQRSAWKDRLAFYDVRRGYGQFAPGSGPGSLWDGAYRRNAFSASGTAFLGNHEVKAGVNYEYLNSGWTDTFSGGGQVVRYLSSGAGSLLYAGHSAYAKQPLNCQVRTDGATGNFGLVDPTTCNAWEATGSARVDPRTHNLAAFLQDSWKVLPGLTVNAGLRYEEQRIYDNTGNARIRLTDQLSPRVGVAWDPLGKGRSKVQASYGRFYQAIPQLIQNFAMGSELFIYAYNYTGDRLDLVNDGNVAPFEYIAGSDYVPPGIKGIYQDEFIVGVEAEVLRNWSVGVKGIYRALGRALEDRCDVFDPRSGLADLVPPGSFTTCAMMNPGEGTFGQLADPRNPDCWETGPDGTVSKPCKPVRATRYFRGLQLDVKRRFSERFQLQASYLLSKLDGNYDGFVNERIGQTAPTLNTDFDIPERLIYVDGPLSLDRRHQLRLTGLYAFGFGLQAGVNASFATGGPLSITGWAPSGYQQYLSPRGTWDQLPSTYQVDLHLEYPVRVGPVTFSPLVDVFNVTNAQTAIKRGESYNNLRTADQGPPYTNPTVPTFGQDTAWQAPRIVRLGARIGF